MKRTNKYGLAFFEKGDFTGSIPEMQRWETLDNQLYALFNIIGNGVLGGWNLILGSGLSVVVTPGSGHVSFVAVESVENAVLTLQPSTRNYIYASLASDSYWTKRTSFSSTLFENPNTNVLLLGYVDTNEEGIDLINTDGKKTLGFVGLIENLVKNHKHIGGATNPSRINLSTEVNGILSQENIPELDASVLKTGTIGQERLPKISHIDGLVDNGELTHSQIDSFINLLSLPDQKTMGEASTINLLQLILAIKHIYPDIDEFLLNEIAFIPGISPDSYIDLINTTAIVDTRPSSEGGTHTISGIPSSGTKTYTKIWKSEDDFASGTQTRVVVIGDSVSLSTKENLQVIDEFTAIENWSIETQDLSSIPSSLVLDPPNSAKLTVNNTSVNVILKIVKTFDSQDWSGFNFIKFYIKTESPDHGDLFFYIRDNIYGEQNSYIKVLEKNAPTVDQDTQLLGWQEVIVDVSGFKRENINEIGFYVSTQNGWDTSKGFSLNIKSIFLSSGNIYENDGHLYLTFGRDFLYNFWKLKWDSIIPTDSESDEVSLKVRTRVANAIPDLPLSPWTSYYSVSDYEIPNPTSELYKYIEIDFYFEASTSKKRSAVLRKVYLHFYATDVDNSFEYNNKDEWDGGNLFNIDTQTVPGSILIDGINEIGNIYYGTNGSAKQIDSSLNPINKIVGSMLPISTYQVLNGISPSLGTVTGICRGSNGTIWVSDTENDRVLEINKDGSLVRGFMGSFLYEPVDVYSEETEVTSPLSSLSSINVLHSIYSLLDGNLYIICNNAIDLSSINLEKIYLKIGSNRIYLTESEVSLLGMGNSTTSGNQFVKESHILKITPLGSDKTTLEALISSKQPSVVISSPLQREKVTSTITVQLLTFNFDLGTQVGEPSIKVTLDGNSQIVYSKTISYSGLTGGEHQIKVELLDENGLPYDNAEALAEGSFVVMGSYSLPYFYFESPCINQIYSSSPVKIDFVLENFAIVPNGQHIRYTVDGGVPVDHYSTDSIILYGLDSGKHVLSVYTVDQNGNTLSYPYGEAEIEFIVGLNSKYILKLCVEKEAIYSLDKTNFVPIYREETTVSNIYLKNIYSPIDLQLVLPENNDPTILIAKMRSPSWVDLSQSDFMDGHSIIELDLSGSLVFSDNNAKISDSKVNALMTLGSCEKIGKTEYLIGDAYNKRAIIVSYNSDTKKSIIQWEYLSDRYVSDFHIVPQEEIEINIYDGSTDISSLSIREGTMVTWKNDSTAPVSIYSGTTTYNLFYEDPNLNLYGDDFHSGTIQVGETYSFVFNSSQNFNWFIYPTILTGTITVSKNRFSDTDQFIVLENDMLESPFSSRVIRVNTFGEIVWTFGENYLVRPRDARPQLSNKVLIST